MTEPRTPELFELLLMTPDIETLPIPSAPYYVVDKGGFLVHKQTRIGRVLVRLDDPPDNIVSFDKLGMFWGNIPKLPADLLGQVWSFFRQALTDMNSEAAVLLLLDSNNNYSVHVPDQKVDHTSVDYSYKPQDIPDGQTLVGTIHSHCDFSAFHSGTDESDAAKNDGIHLTFGHVDKEQPEIDIMLSFNGVMWKKLYKLADIGPTEPLTLIDHPTWWITSLTKAPPPAWSKPATSYKTTATPKPQPPDFINEGDEIEEYYRAGWMQTYLNQQTNADQEAREYYERQLVDLQEIAAYDGFTLIYDLR